MISSVSVDNACVRQVSQTSSVIFTLVRDILPPQSLSLSLDTYLSVLLYIFGQVVSGFLCFHSSAYAGIGFHGGGEEESEQVMDRGEGALWNGSRKHHQSARLDAFFGCYNPSFSTPSDLSLKTLGINLIFYWLPYDSSLLGCTTTHTLESFPLLVILILGHCQF